MWVGHYWPPGRQWPTHYRYIPNRLEPPPKPSAARASTWPAAASSAATTPTAPTSSEGEPSAAAAGNQLYPLRIRARPSV